MENKKYRVTPRGSPKQQKATKLMATPIFCRPEPRTTPLQTPCQQIKKKTFVKRQLLS